MKLNELTVKHVLEKEKKKKYLESIVNQVISANDIVDVISSYIKMKPIGTSDSKSFVCRCPFHNENTDSLVVRRDKGIFKCFSCGASGNVISFIERIEGLGHDETIEFLAQRSGTVLPLSE